MKIRQNFVPNSSSCSFIIDKYGLTEEQIEHIEYLGTYDYYSEQDGIIDIECKDKIDSYELEVDSCNSGHYGYLAVSQELNFKNIKYGVEW